MAYVVVVNIPNNVATVHRDTCVHLGDKPLAQTASAERLAAGDGLEAVVLAARAGKARTALCGHCLHEAAHVIRVVV